MQRYCCSKRLKSSIIFSCFHLIASHPWHQYPRLSWRGRWLSLELDLKQRSSGLVAKKIGSKKSISPKNDPKISISIHKLCEISRDPRPVVWGWTLICSAARECETSFWDRWSQFEGQGRWVLDQNPRILHWRPLYLANLNKSGTVWVFLNQPGVKNADFFQNSEKIVISDLTGYFCPPLTHQLMLIPAFCVTEPIRDTKAPTTVSSLENGITLLLNTKIGREIPNPHISFIVGEHTPILFKSYNRFMEYCFYIRFFK